MKRIIAPLRRTLSLALTAAALAPAPSSAQTQPTLGISSPDGRLQMEVSLDDAGVHYRLTRDGQEVVGASDMAVLTTTGDTLGGAGTQWMSSTESSVRRTIESALAERSVQPDRYNQAILQMQTAGTDFGISIRVYDEGFAFRFAPDATQGVGMKADLSTVDLSARGLTWLTETAAESGYDRRTGDGVFTSWTPLFAYADNLAVLINEADNPGAASKASLRVSGGKVGFVQKSTACHDGYAAPWRYVIVAGTPADMLEGKYIIRSLCPDTDADTGWIVPGKAFRSLATGTTCFYTDTVCGSIDFAAANNFQYVLLDAGWYGLGYSEEDNPASDPTQPVSTLGMDRVAAHAADKGIGLIAYVNQAAWQHYDNDAIVDLYASWGISGIKMGYVDGLNESGLRQIYHVASRAAAHRMVLNVHDNMRPTGAERTYPNLLTSEGIRGNEHTDHTTDHTLTLPFARLMTGPADYTFCFAGYPPDAHAKVAQMVQTKGHQMALSVIYFSPLQHLLWYGRPWWYATRPAELEFFRRLETVWDDYRIVEARPAECFSMARRKDDRWFVAAATNSQSRSMTVGLDFLDPAFTYNAVIFEDDGLSGVVQSEVQGLTAGRELTFALEANGGAVAIVSKAGESSTDRAEAGSCRIVMLGGRINVVGLDMTMARLCDMSGRTIATAQAQAAGTLCSLPGELPAGVYAVSVRTAHGIRTFKIKL